MRQFSVFDLSGKLIFETRAVASYNVRVNDDALTYSTPSGAYRPGSDYRYHVLPFDQSKPARVAVTIPYRADKSTSLHSFQDQKHVAAIQVSTLQSDEPYAVAIYELETGNKLAEFKGASLSPDFPATQIRCP